MNNADKLRIIMADPCLWIETFCVAVDKRGNKVKFKLNNEQRDLISSLQKFTIIDKSRQIGISYCLAAYSLWLAITKPNSSCMLICHTGKATQEIWGKLKQLFNNLPDCVKPKLDANNRKELSMTNGSNISCTTMSNTEIGRGSTLQFVHLSEVAFMKTEALDNNMLALTQSLAPSGKMILESTANGINLFSEMYQTAERGESLYEAKFYSWIDDKIMFEDEYKEFCKIYYNLNGKNLEEYELDDKERLYFNMGASLEQLTWRRMKIKNTRGGEPKFTQEFPANSMESFLTTGNNLFNAERVMKKYNDAIHTKPLKINTLTIPTDIKPYINYLKVWDIPVSGMKYYIGCDCSDGVGADYHVITVLDSDFKEVAEFRTNKIAPHEVGKVIYSMGIWYNTALLVVEKASGGVVVLDRLKNTYHYRNLYKYVDFDARGKRIKKIGFNTTAKSKPLLINDLIELFDNNDIFICSLDLLNEMKTYEYTDGKMNASKGNHDDTIISIGLAVQGCKSAINYK